MTMKNSYPLEIYFGTSPVTTKGIKAIRTAKGYSAVLCEVMHEKPTEETEFQEKNIAGEYVRLHFQSYQSLHNLIEALQKIERIWKTEMETK